MENFSPEVFQITVSCIKSLAISFLGYSSLITGLEIGGRIRGYPGRGAEIHEQIMKTIFKGNKKKK